jgi:flagellar hook-basal body complex protein FliE
VIPPIGALSAGGFSLETAAGAQGAGAAEAAAGAQQLAGTQSATGVEGAQSATGVEGAQSATGVEGAQSATGTSPSFGSSLTEAISSLEGTQLKANGAAQALATGTVKDPESAVTTVEDAAMAMQLAAQIRAKATEAAQTIFQTQV